MKSLFHRVPALSAHWLGLALALAMPARALAHSSGSGTEGCSGCHNGGATPSVLITPDSASIAPGQLLNLTVSISTTNGQAAGFYLTASSGKFSIVDSGTKLVASGVTHSATRTGTAAAVTFKVGWTAPVAPGGVDFSAWGNSVNGDRSSRGDGEGVAFYSVTFGCAGSKFYHDYDGDGVGAEGSGYTMACSVPQYYSAKLGDCNDNDPEIFSGNVEVCDAKDNDCDSAIDEGLAIADYCTDADSDGHGVFGKATVSGCGLSKGFGLCDGDCNDTDASIHPGAVELCNNKDDDCDQRIDENARLICGVGWCAMYADGCTSQCTPGQPRAEACNDFDDDCDGVKDNGTDLALCGKAGFVCRDGYCVEDASGVSSGGGSGGTDAGNASSRGGGIMKAAAGRAAADELPPKRSSSAGCNLERAPLRSQWTSAAVLVSLAHLLRRRHRASRLRAYGIS